MANADQGRARLIVADDDVLMREGLVSLLEQGGTKSSARPVTATS